MIELGAGCGVAGFGRLPFTLIDSILLDTVYSYMVLCLRWNKFP